MIKPELRNKILVVLSLIFIGVISVNSQTLINEPGDNSTVVTLTSSSKPASFYIGESIIPSSKFTSFYFGIPKDQDIKITVTDILGKEIKAVTSGSFKAGIYKAEFNFSMRSSGVYFYKIESSEYTEIKKFTVII